MHHQAANRDFDGHLFRAENDHQGPHQLYAFHISQMGLFIGGTMALPNHFFNARASCAATMLDSVQLLKFGAVLAFRTDIRHHPLFRRNTNVIHSEQDRLRSGSMHLFLNCSGVSKSLNEVGRMLLVSLAVPAVQELFRFTEHSNSPMES